MIIICAFIESYNVAALLQAIVDQYNVHIAWFDVGYGGC
jgi:hypothetical protein